MAEACWRIFIEQFSCKIDADNMQFAHHYHMMSPTYHLLHKHILQNKCTSTSDFWITGSNAVMALCIPHYYMDSDVTWGNGMGCTLLALSADLQSVHGFHCYDDIAPNTKCQRVLRFMPGILVFFPFKPHVWQKLVFAGRNWTLSSRSFTCYKHFQLRLHTVMQQLRRPQLT